jgi:hypothetical protein
MQAPTALSQQVDERNQNVTEHDERLVPGVVTQEQFLLVVARRFQNGVAELAYEQRRQAQAHGCRQVAEDQIVAVDKRAGAQQV